MRVTVKVCGLTSAADAAAARRCGADYLGFVFFPQSLRCLSVEDAAWIRGIEGVPKVGVFRDQEPAFIREVRDAAGLDLVQLHGGEGPECCAALGGEERVVKAIPVSDGPLDWRTVRSFVGAARILFDTATPRGGGSGRTFDWRLLAERPADLAFWLAGGLDPGNVGEAILTLRPAGVDVASGVETGVGRKDAGRMQAFVDAVRAAEVRAAVRADAGRNGR